MLPVKRVTQSLLLLLATVPVSGNAEPFGNDQWQPQFELEGMAFSNGRQLAVPKMMVPLVQARDSMLFTDIRIRLDNEDSQEVNAGLGYRQIYDEWVVGGYLFLDYLNSPFDNEFMQATLGAEVMTETWELRSNLYLPESTEKRTGTGQLVVGGTTVGMRGGFERALPGVDGEVGYRLPVSFADDLRIYGGGYYYDASDYRTVAGPRTRVELTLGEEEIPALQGGSELTLGAGMQHDSMRDSQYFGLVSLRIPFGDAHNSGRDTPPLHRRMMQFIERDLDVVSTNSGPLEPVSIEGRSRSVTAVNANDDIATVVANADEYALILVDGSAGAISTTEQIVLREGQILAGGSGRLNIRGTKSNTSISGIIPGSMPVINGNGITAGSSEFGYYPVIETKTKSKVTGLEVVGNSGQFGVYVPKTITDVSLTDLTLEGYYGILVNSNNVTISDVLIQSANLDTGILLRSFSDNVTISNSTINNPRVGILSLALQNGKSVAISDTVVNSPDKFGADLQFSAASSAVFNGFVVNNAGEIGIRTVFPADLNLTINDSTFNGAGISGLSIDGGTVTLSGSNNQIFGNVPTPCRNHIFATVTGSLSFSDGTSTNCP